MNHRSRIREAEVSCVVGFIVDWGESLDPDNTWTWDDMFNVGPTQRAIL